MVGLVSGQFALELVDNVKDAFKHLPEDWVAHSGFVVFESTRDEAIVIKVHVHVVVASEEHAVVIFEIAIIVGVNTVLIALQKISENVDAVLVLQVDLVSLVILNISLIDGSVETVFEVLCDLNQFLVAACLQIVIVLTVGHLKSIDIFKVSENSVLNGSVDRLILNIVESVALTLQVESGQKLLDLVEITLTTTVDLVLVIVVELMSMLHVESLLSVGVLIHLLVVDNS